LRCLTNENRGGERKDLSEGFNIQGTNRNKKSLSVDNKRQPKTKVH